MIWVILEVLFAFGLAIFIVWWTIPKKKRLDADKEVHDDVK